MGERGKVEICDKTKASDLIWGWLLSDGNSITVDMEVSGKRPDLKKKWKTHLPVSDLENSRCGKGIFQREGALSRKDVPRLLTRSTQPNLCVPAVSAIKIKRKADESLTEAREASLIVLRNLHPSRPRKPPTRTGTADVYYCLGETSTPLLEYIQNSQSSFIIAMNSNRPLEPQTVKINCRLLKWQTILFDWW